MFVLYGLFSLPQGWIAARIGRKNLMGVFFIGTGLSMAATGLANTPNVLAITLAATGFFAAIYHPIGTAMLVEAAGHRPGRAPMYSVRFFVGFLGSAFAAPLVGYLHERTGTLAAFVIVLAVFALITLGCALFFPDRAEELAPETWNAVPAPAE
jgi:MFS family permease